MVFDLSFQRIDDARRREFVKQILFCCQQVRVVNKCIKILLNFLKFLLTEKTVLAVIECKIEFWLGWVWFVDQRLRVDSLLLLRWFVWSLSREHRLDLRSLVLRINQWSFLNLIINLHFYLDLGNGLVLLVGLGALWLACRSVDGDFVFHVVISTIICNLAANLWPWVFNFTVIWHRLLLFSCPIVVDVGADKLKQNLSGCLLGTLLIPAIALWHLNIIDLYLHVELHVWIFGELVSSKFERWVRVETIIHWILQKSWRFNRLKIELLTHRWRPV